MSDKVDFKTKNVIRDTERYFIMANLPGRYKR